MKLTYLAHASLLVESGAVRLVTDPWLDGPTYLSAWWHFPEPAAHGSDLSRVTHVYLTHEHVDHFHAPTLSALSRATTILIGRFMSARFRRKLAALGFERVRELPHAEEVELDGGLRLTSYQYRADDTALVISDESATLFDLNDCLLRGRSLARVLERHPRIDVLFASFANAEAYPIVYDFDDPAERVDWDDSSRFDTFLERVRQIGPRAFTPFASMFCFLADDLYALNDRIVSPARLLERARAGEVRAEALPLNPGDVWTPERGHEIKSTVDWARKSEILGEYAQRHRQDVLALAAAESVPGGKAALRDAFGAFFRGFVARVPLPLRSRLDLSILFDVAGPAGGPLWLRFARGRLDLDPPASDDAWDVRIRIGDWPLWRMVTRADTWQTLGVSCRFRVTLRRGARDREVFFWFLLYLDEMGYLSPARLLTPRALGVLWRRRSELGEYLRSLAGGRFTDEALRGKFEV